MRRRGLSPSREASAEMLTEAFWGQTPLVSKVAHSHGCWQEASAPHRPDLSGGRTERPRDRASFPESPRPKTARQKPRCLLGLTTGGDTPPFSQHPITTRAALFYGEGLHRGTVPEHWVPSEAGWDTITAGYR